MSGHVTVLMRTKNVASILPQTLQALYSQNFRDFNLLIVDSGSSDATVKVAGTYPCEIKQIAADDYFPGKVLNEALQTISSSLIVLLNSDAVLLTPDSLGNLLAAFEDPAIQAAFGRQVARPDAEGWVVRDYGASFPEQPPPPHWMYLSFAFAAIRKSAWERLPFYTAAWGSEDTEWGHRATREGYQIAYMPLAFAMHSHNYTLKQLYGRRFIEGEADAFIYRGQYSFAKMCLNVIKAIGRDLIFYSKTWRILKVWKLPFLRFVYYWAYYRGHQLGEKRLESGDPDARTGQKTVLKRY